MMYMQEGMTALHHAESAEVAKVLLDNGANPNAQDTVCSHACLGVVLCVGSVDVARLVWCGWGGGARVGKAG